MKCSNAKLALSAVRNEATYVRRNRTCCAAIWAEWSDAWGVRMACTEFGSSEEAKKKNGEKLEPETWSKILLKWLLPILLSPEQLFFILKTLEQILYILGHQNTKQNRNITQIKKKHDLNITINKTIHPNSHCASLMVCVQFRELELIILTIPGKGHHALAMWMAFTLPTKGISLLWSSFQKLRNPEQESGDREKKKKTN